jgi:hypothetical protein
MKSPGRGDIELRTSRIRVEELPERYGPLAFLFPTEEKPVFKNNQEEVTRDAANRLAEERRQTALARFGRSLSRRTGRENAIKHSWRRRQMA